VDMRIAAEAAAILKENFYGLGIELVSNAFGIGTDISANPRSCKRRFLKSGFYKRTPLSGSKFCLGGAQSTSYEVLFLCPKC